MAKAKIGFLEVEGLAELREQFKDIRKVPKKVLTKSAKEGVAKPFAEAKADMPVGKGTTTSGLLKKGLKKTRETVNKRNKVVYRVHWDKKFAVEGLYKKRTSGKFGGVTPFAYYPHSVEYGYKTGQGYKEGRYIAIKAVARNQEDSIKKIMDVLWDYIKSV